MASLDEQFQVASKHFEGIYQNCSNKQKLTMYALWNQATEGDVDVSKPPARSNVVKFAKFQARKKLIGMSKDLAKRKYISELHAIDPTWAINEPAEEEPPAETDKKKKKEKKLKKSSPGDLNTEFQAAAEYAFRSKKFKFENQRTLLYAYYKQATVGPCNRPAPSVFAGRHKYARWRAWANLFDMPSDEAKRLYIAQVKKIAPDFDGSSTSTRNLLQAEDEEPDSDDEWDDPDTRLEKMESMSPSGLTKMLSDCKAKGGLLYVLTGATGFLGKHLLELLLHRNEGSIVICITRPSSMRRLINMSIERYGDQAADRVIPLSGDISKPNLGLNKDIIQVLKSTGVDHLFHLAAVYDLKASEEANRIANVEGTRFAMNLAETLGCCFEYTSSIAVAGNHNGIFLESSFEEGQQFSNPYTHTKYLAEKLVRKECKTEYRIYRPGIVVGSSVTGEADKIDGPYYLFKPLQQIKRYVPSGVVLPCVEGETIPIVPVDYVVRAMDAIAHKRDSNSKGKAYHLVDPSPHTFVETLNIISKAATGPQFSSRLETLALAMLPQKLFATLDEISILKSAPHFFATNIFGIPPDVVDYIYFTTEFDDSETRDALRGTGIHCPKFEKYAWRLWDYYARFMDRSLDKPKALANAVRNKVVVVTGASDGIGRTLALRLGRAGAHVVIVARSADKLKEVAAEIQGNGGNVSWYTADLSNEGATDKMIKAVLKDHGYVDILVNNAGRSIRRSVEYQYDRFHDFTRCIDLNYYGSLRCILGFLPEMRARQEGQIINVSSIGAVTFAPRFGAYIASKSALDAFSKCISGEIAPDHITMSTIYMPLVRTKMVVSKGNKYDHADLLTPEQAAGLIEKAIVTKARQVMTYTGWVVSVGHFLWPSLVESMLNIMYRLEPEEAPEGKTKSSKAAGDKEQLRLVSRLLSGAI